MNTDSGASYLSSLGVRVLAVAATSLSLLGTRLVFAEPNCAAPRDAPVAYFYRGQDYGSESQFNPLTVLINGGFDITRNPSYTSRLSDIEFGIGLENVARNLANPQLAIGEGGLGRVVAHEILPYRGLESRYGQWIPNIFLHTLGEGMLFRKTTEWYRAKCFPSPHVFGLLTIMSMQLLNETVENGAYQGPNEDPVIDMYLFNLLGYTLFSFDVIAQAFNGTVQLNYWPGQAVFDVTRGVLFNHGENYSFQVGLGNWTKVKFFSYFGAEGLFGASVPVKGHLLSFGFGTRLLELEVDEGKGTRIMRPAGGLNWAGGIFLERNHSLIASLIASAGVRPIASFNLYPSILQIGDIKFGAYASGGEEEGYSIGITLSGAPVVPGFLIAPNPKSVRF